MNQTRYQVKSLRLDNGQWDVINIDCYETATVLALGIYNNYCDTKITKSYKTVRVIEPITKNSYILHWADNQDIDVIIYN